MKVLLTGATGLLGGALLDRLVEEGHEVRCLVRPESPNAARLDPERAEVARGDAGDVDALSRTLAGAEAMVHAAGLEYAPPVVAALRRSGVERLVIIGSTSVHSKYEHRSGWRRRMEELVRGSGLRWTIARPAMIYGSERDKNVSKLLRFLDRSPVYPMFGPGTNLWQPVYHEDLARGIFAALVRPEALYQSYDLPGARPLTYLDLVRSAAGSIGRKPRLIKLPIEPVRRALQFSEALRLPLPVASEQVLRLREDKAYPYEKARRELGYAPRTFPEGVALEAARLREIGLVSSY